MKVLKLNKILHQSPQINKNTTSIISYLIYYIEDMKLSKILHQRPEHHIEIPPYII
jgi:hypothetical protein